MGRRFGEARLGALVLAGSENGATCLNGMPVAPGSVRMLGRLGRLQSLDHPLLTRHMALVRCTTVPNAAILLFEHYESSVKDLLQRNELSVDDVCTVAGQLAEALSYLHEQSIIAGSLDVDKLLILPHANNGTSVRRISIRLGRFGLPLLSENGRDLLTPIGSAFILSPERVLWPQKRRRIQSSSMTSRVAPCSRAADVWAVGVVLMEMMTGVVLSEEFTAQEWLRVLNAAITKFAGTSQLDVSLFAALAEEVCSRGGKSATRQLERVQRLQPQLAALAAACLQLRPRLRPTAAEIEALIKAGGYNGQSSRVEEAEEMMPIEEEMESGGREGNALKILGSLSMDDAFFLWALSGASAERILLEAGKVKTKPCVLAGAVVASDDMLLSGNDEGRRFDATTKTTVMSMDNLIEKLNGLDPLSLLYSAELNEAAIPQWKNSDDALPVIVKEKDVSYQAARLILLAHLLPSHYFLTSQISFSARYARLLEAAFVVDVPPMRRAGTWRVLLDASPLDNDLPQDTISPHQSDRQLEVDIPRCHQYEEVMTSPSAHYKLKRLLKSWLEAHPQYVYWQGLDSLAAPFLLLNFENIPMALSCMSTFIDRYLRDFFLKDNSHIIQEYLAVFNHLIAYIDATLYTTLADMDFFPELFAIPWFLTCFAHVLPLHKLMHVWDALLRATTTFPLFVGVSLLLQLRPSLIDACFNDVILLFSDLPDVQIDRILADSLSMYSRVPRSCVFLAQRREEGHTITHYTAAQLKEMCCPRLSLEDLISLIRRNEVAVIDVRTPPEFYRGSVTNSVNYPNIEDQSMGSIRTLLATAQENLHTICIVDVKTLCAAKKLAANLVRAGVSGVAILDGGYDVVRMVPALIRVGSTTDLP